MFSNSSHCVCSQNTTVHSTKTDESADPSAPHGDCRSPPAFLPLFLPPIPTEIGIFTILRAYFRLPGIQQNIGVFHRRQNHQHHRVAQPVQIHVSFDVETLREEGKEVLGCEPLQSISFLSIYRRDILDHQHVLSVHQLVTELIHNTVKLIDSNRQRMEHVIQVQSVQTLHELSLQPVQSSCSLQSLQFRDVYLAISPHSPPSHRNPHR